jgi:uncharacterized protein (DUF1499 family)
MSLKLIPVVIIILIAVYLASLSFTTRHHRIKPENVRHLSPCPDKPNCVSSQSSQEIHAIAAFSLIENNRSQNWKQLTLAVKQAGGEILVDDGHYCHAIFTSSLFRFKDDFEAELGDARIEVRSASRAGNSDLGQNRKRVEQIRQLYMGLNPTDSS